MLVVTCGFETLPWSLAGSWVLLKTKERRIKIKDEIMQFPFIRLFADVFSWDTEAGEGNGFAGSQVGGCLALLRCFLCEQSTFWQAPHLSCQLSPFFHKNQCVRNGLRDPVPTDIFLIVGEKREKKKESNREEFVAWNMEWFETETASWILNCGRCMEDDRNLDNAVRATLPRLMSSPILGLTDWKVVIFYWIIFIFLMLCFIR